MAGFGKNSGPFAFGTAAGPSLPPQTLPLFGASIPQSPSPSPTPPPNNPTPPHHQSQRLGTHTHFPLDNRPPEALKRTRSPPLVYGGNRSIVYPQEETQGLGTRMHFPPDNRPPEASKRTRSPPLVYGGNHSIVYPQEESQGPSVSPQRGIRPKSPVNIANAQVQERPLLSYADLDNPGSRFPIVPPDFQAQKRTRSPPLPLPDKVSFENLQHAQGNTERPAGYAKLARTKSPVNDANAQVPWSTSLITPYVDQDDPRTRFLSRPANFRALKWTRSPPLPSADKVPMGNLTAESSKAPQGMQPPPLAFESNRFDNELHYPFEEAQRSAISPPTWGSQPKSPVSHANSQNHQKYLLGATGVDPNNPDAGTRVPTKSANFQVPKRTGSPILSSAKVLLESSPSIQDDGEREAQAKAKRLARFRVELSQPPLGLYDPTKNKVPGNTHDQAPEEKQRVVTKLRLEEVGDFPIINTSFDSEGLHATNAVIGLCLDMCPESEREERERKGDLDKYERLDGDRNQTSKSIAVKKYNRTAEREAELIRPMPVLQKTIDYLLGLLDQPYDEKFLGMYNFLWDRMRAIRMDLRMQHIFNRDAITMLEQMIRLHIIAMHELCEYTKGEGFSEGFDAHLNIEQMNKASAELFQLYDDHRKKGISVPSEKEFRGYYALLKLDRHPGYKVEPAELSLDLAKMPREIRSTPEVIFARDVARACRTGNFIVFFQLARRATYLQACLMHAHFTKLRTQAIASLHSGLQNNQGIPVAQVVKWLGMEGEDIEILLEYHGFSIKNFEDAYMVKDGPFLNGDVDFDTKCSQLVHLKKSRTIIDDVLSSQVFSVPSEVEKIVPNKLKRSMPSEDHKSVSSIRTKSLSDVADEDMPDYEDDPIPFSKTFHQVHPTLETPSSSDQEDENDSHMDETSSLLLADESFHHYMLETEVGDLAAVAPMNSSPAVSQCSLSKEMVPQSPKGRFSQKDIFGVLHSPRTVANPVPPEIVIRHQENEAMMPSQNDEVAAAKLKMILRIWKQRSLRRRELREQREMTAIAALSSLSLGFPIRRNQLQWSHAGELNIDNVARERLYVQTKSWSRLNVSEVVVPVLKETNSGSKCICWKLIACSQMNDIGREKSTQKIQSNHLSGTWLRSKLMSSRNEVDNELLISSYGLSIWSKWVSDPRICCLSVIRDIAFDSSKPVVEDDAVSGVNAVLFLASERIPWEFQRTRLHNLLISLPLGSSLPLLILIDGPYEKDVPDPSFQIVKKLGLHDIDRTQISTFSVVFLSGNCSPENINGFFSDDKLREGLKWLANMSSPQPVLLEVKMHELVLSYLGSMLEAIESKGNSEVGPDDCILVFNKALDQSVQDILAAADMNHSYWPSPEIYMLNKLSSEHRAVSLFLPVINWSSAERIQSTINPIKDCKLPSFGTDLSWLHKGSDMGKEIQHHKLMLEKCLTWYLNQASKMMGEDLAVREASVILQTGAGLELDGSTYRIVPRWVMIFRRIFNWRLMNLVCGTFSVAYVLGHPSTPDSDSSNMNHLFTQSKLRDTDMRTNVLKGLDDFGLRRHQWSHYPTTELTLDEIIEVGCQLPFGPPTESVPAAVQPLASTINNVSEVLEATHGSPGDGEDLRQDGFAEAGNSSLSHEQNKSSEKVTKAKEADRLSMLLEQCDTLQDMIGEKLAIYF
ncbi:hypothetical protein AAC387_Pa03g2272 [Persea americana]